MHRQREIYCKAFAHAIMEAAKSPDVQSASWRPRRADGVVLVQVRKTENQEIGWFKF